MKLKVGTWNIGGGFVFRGKVQDALSYEEENLDYFIEQVKSFSPDILALQEAHQPDDSNKVTQTQLVGEAIGYSFTPSYKYGPSHIKSGNQLSLGTISRFPILENRFHKLPNPGLTILRPNGATWVSFDVGFLTSKINIDGMEIKIINGHMVPFQYFKRSFIEPEFAPVREDIEKLLIASSITPTVVLADFNYADLKELLPSLFRNGLYESGFEGVETSPGKGQQDHILFSKHWTLNKYSVNKVTADHYLCLTEIELK